MRFPWFNSKPDPVLDRATGLVAHAEQRVMAALPTLAERFPALRAVDPGGWRRHATVAATKLAVYPLLRAVDGDAVRFDRIVERLRRDLVARFPTDAALWTESDRATIPPTGHERTGTLADVDEAQSLALARWTVAAVAGSGAVSGGWDTVKGVAEALRQATVGFWRPWKG